MKYYLLKNIVEYLKEEAKNIKLIKRVDNNTLYIEFNNKNIIYFDMTRGNSCIYKKNTTSNTKKDFNAPFDVVLQKRINSSRIEKVELYEDDKVINIRVNSSSSYKKLITILQLEFTGKHTNAILLDENRIVLEALRHIDEFSSSRIVKVGHKLDSIPKANFQFEEKNIENIEEKLYCIYENLELKKIENSRKQKISQIAKKLEKLEKMLNKLPKKEDLSKESNKQYEEANLVLSKLHEIKPYQKVLETFNYKQEKVHIQLSDKMSPSKYSNELFKKAKRLKQRAENIIIEKQNLDEKIEFLKRMISSLENAKSIDEIEFLYPKKEKNQTKTKKSKNYESFFFEGYKIMLGTNEKENIYLLENSKSSDFWFHLKDAPSSHVIVQNSKKTIPQSVIEKAAIICAKFSTNFSGTYSIDYTQRRNVKIQNRANVLYNPYTTLTIKI